MRKEREAEAKNPGPTTGGEAAEDARCRTDGAGDKRNDHCSQDGDQAEKETTNGDQSTKVNLELINVSSIATNGRAVWERPAHVQIILETLVPPEAAGTYQWQAKQYNKVLEMGPLDPEANKAAAGVGIVAVEGLRPYKLPNPT